MKTFQNMNLTPKTVVKLYAHKYTMSFQVRECKHVSNYIYNSGVWLTGKGEKQFTSATTADSGFPHSFQ